MAKDMSSPIGVNVYSNRDEITVLTGMNFSSLLKPLNFSITNFTEKITPLNILGVLNLTSKF